MGQGTAAMDRRKFLEAALAVPFAGCATARAQSWPTRTITMIVAFPPGGQADLAARPVAAALEKILGRSVVVDNRSGAGGMLGAQVDITAQAPGPINPHLQSGAARALASWGGKRTPELADIPTMIELGYREVEYYIWAGLFAPKGTPAPVTTRLRDAMRQV